MSTNEFKFSSLYHSMPTAEDAICLPIFNEGMGFMDTLAHNSFPGVGKSLKGRNAQDGKTLRDADGTALIKTLTKFGLNKLNRIHGDLTGKMRNSPKGQCKLALAMMALHSYFMQRDHTVGKDLSKIAVLFSAGLCDVNKDMAEFVTKKGPQAELLAKVGLFRGNVEFNNLFLNMVSIKAFVNSDIISAKSVPNLKFYSEFSVFVMSLLNHSSMIVLAYWLDISVPQIARIMGVSESALESVQDIFDALDKAAVKNCMKIRSDMDPIGISFTKDILESFEIVQDIAVDLVREQEMKSNKPKDQKQVSAKPLQLGAPLTADQMPIENLIEIQSKIAEAIAQRSAEVVESAAAELDEARSIELTPTPIKEKIGALTDAIRSKASELQANPMKAGELHRLVNGAKTVVSAGIQSLATVKTRLAEAFQAINTEQIAQVAGELNEVSKVIIQDLELNAIEVNALQIKPVDVDMVPRADYVAMENLYVDEINNLKHLLQDSETRNQECQLKLSEAGRLINQKPETVERIEIPKPIMRLLCQENMSMSDIVPTLSDLFPHVVFLDGVREQAEQSKFARPRQLFSALMRLCGEYYEALMKGIPDSEAMNILGDVYRANESDSVTNNEKMSRLRTFDLNGTKTFFEQHITVGSRNGEQYTIQVHFKIVNKILYIGRIGSHLPTTAKF